MILAGVLQAKSRIAENGGEATRRDATQGRMGSPMYVWQGLGFPLSKVFERGAGRGKPAGLLQTKVAVPSMATAWREIKKPGGGGGELL